MPKGISKRARTPRPLTAKQREVLNFITERVDSFNYPPTLREICDRFNMHSTNAARCVLKALEDKNFIIRRSSLARGIALTSNRRRQTDSVRVPIVGSVAAGTPLLAEENLDGELIIDRTLFPSGDGFALRVRGDSMTGDGINDGDIVLARQDYDLTPGSIVVALIGDEATVKRCFKEGNVVRLEPSNPDFKAIEVHLDREDFRIVGRVVGLFRRY